MAGKETNPIQQRMELLAEKWEAAVAKPGISIVRIHAQESEKEMVETFCTYLLGIDTPNRDIPIIFESIYHDDEQYTRALVDELKGLIDVWNNANRDAVSIKTDSIRWQPDYSLINKDNPAFLFTENLNRLAAYLGLSKGVYLVAVLKVSFIEAAQFCRWLGRVLKAGMHQKCRLLVYDTAAHPFFNTIAAGYPNQVYTLEPVLDMDNAMQQVAAMGNPNDAAVQYRQAFVQLMQAIEKRSEKDAQVHADVCIDIAINNLEKSPYWIGQVIAIYAALANDQVGYKNYTKAIGFASEGVVAAAQSVQLIKDEFICRKFQAQAVMLRGSLYTVNKDWENALDDFEAAANHYMYTNDIILAMEACRMAAYCNRKFGNINAACAWLAKAVEYSRQMPAHIIKVTTFAGVIEMLLEINNEQSVSRQEVEAAAEAVYGTEWMKEILNWKNPHYEPVTDASKTIAV
jgi:tetratricopeptide (TPR) repeat protein